MSSQLLRTVKATGKRRALLGRRCASHGAPHYNEPGGWLFGEKVRLVRTEIMHADGHRI